MLAATKALSSIHSANIVHRDIKAHNIIYNENTKELKLSILALLALLIKQNSFISMNSSLEGTLAYISPEQTGRMNRTVDYRTDYYSLGVTFYQIITGDIPFIYSDPMELVHAHIAKIQFLLMKLLNHVALLQVGEAQITKVISDIIMKLLQKNPEDRYQSAYGILHDLEWCIKKYN